MIAYFDASAIVPLLIDEPGSASAVRSWLAAERVVSARLVYAEARAALAAAQRAGRLTRRHLRTAVEALDRLDADLGLIELTNGLVRRAGSLAEGHGLRGFDAIHLACAEAVADADLAFVAGDRDLLAAAAGLGMVTIDTAPG